MNNGEHINKIMRAITISRQYGSGGGEIAVRLARHLGWHLIDHQVVAQVAQRMQVSQEEAAENDERLESLPVRILKSFQYIQPTMPVAIDMPPPTDEQDFFTAYCQVIDAAVTMGHVVIVGRGSQAHLGLKRDLFHTLIVAPLDARIRYVMKREKLDQVAARERIHRKEEERVRYIQNYYHIDPHEAQLYDLTVNTGFIDLDSAVEIICQTLECKARRHNVSTQDLGPEAGLEAYP